MNVVMFTNTHAPHVGGVARSVDAFTRQLRALGHRVLVVAPEDDDAPAREQDTFRVPAVQDFSGSDFSVPVALPSGLWVRLDTFRPDIVHTHHPFLLGDTAMRAAAAHDTPTVFTHHTRYEDYTHYVPGDSPLMRRFVVELVTGYCDLCDVVVAPSPSIEKLLRERGVGTRIEVIPTGVDTRHFGGGDGAALRRRLSIPPEAKVLGHVGRLAPEKSIRWMSEPACRLMREREGCHLVVAGGGPSSEDIREVAAAEDVSERVHLLGPVDRADLPDVYAAMDLFVFASLTETQGLVLAEAMAAGVPVVARDAPGAREVVRDGRNGRLLDDPSPADFGEAMRELLDADASTVESLRDGARATAADFSERSCAERLESVYRELLEGEPARPEVRESQWEVARRRIGREWELWRNMAEAARDALTEEEPPDARPG